MSGLPVTVVHPDPCPWGFNPLNRSPTLLESTRHMLCEIENAASTSAQHLWDDIVGFLDWAWAQLQSLVVAPIQQAAQDLWNRVKPVFDYVMAEARQGTINFLLLIAAGLLGVVTLGEFIAGN